MPNFKDITESRAVPVTEEELRQFLESNVWLAICQEVRAQQRGIYSSIRAILEPTMRTLMYAHVDQLDDFTKLPSKIRERNIYQETPAVKAEILSNLKEQLKGDIEQWKSKQ
jgi:cysteine sulfinate desulfinase/cysteine desulfurase-like protein